MKTDTVAIQVRLPRQLAVALRHQAAHHERKLNTEIVLAAGMAVALGSAAAADMNPGAPGSGDAAGQSRAEFDTLHRAAFRHPVPEAVVRELLRSTPGIGVEVGSPFLRPSY